MDTSMRNMFVVMAGEGICAGYILHHGCGLQRNIMFAKSIDLLRLQSQKVARPGRTDVLQPIRMRDGCAFRGRIMLSSLRDGFNKEET